MTNRAKPVFFYWSQRAGSVMVNTFGAHWRIIGAAFIAGICFGVGISPDHKCGKITNRIVVASFP